MNDIITNIPDYNGPGIYALTDQFGKSYIGSSKHVSQRIFSHNAALTTASEPNGIKYTNKKLFEAAKNGMYFTAHILEKYDSSISKAELIQKEKEYVIKYGGISQTYNCKLPIHIIGYTIDYPRFTKGSIWCFENTTNSKVYLKVSLNHSDSEIKREIRLLEHNQHTCIALQQDYNSKHQFISKILSEQISQLCKILNCKPDDILTYERKG